VLASGNHWRPSVRRLAGSVSVATLAAIALAMLTPGCDDGSTGAAYRPEYAPLPGRHAAAYVFAIHPLHNPEQLFEAYLPLIRYLESKIPDAQFTLEASRNYEEFEKKLAARQFHFALPNPYETLHAIEHGYRVFGKVGEDHDFRGIILVRKDSKIRTLADLKGKAVAFPAPTAVAATLLPQYYLQTNGLDVTRDIRALYVGSQESAIMSVLLGTAAAGATWPQPWERFKALSPEQAAALEVRWETPPLVTNSLVVRDDVDKTLLSRVEGVLFTLHQNKEGRRILAGVPVSRIYPANASAYAPVREFLASFNRVVRQLEN